MSKTKFSVIVLAAGLGTRMKSDLPKALHKVAGREMVGHVVSAFAEAKPDYIVVVKAPDDKIIDSLVSPHKTIIQKERLGTGHAARVGLEALPKNYDGHVIVTVADMPLITTETVEILASALNREDCGVAVLAFRPKDPLRYGRLITTSDGQLLKIVEYKDATASERRVNLCNSGVIAINGKNAKKWIKAIDNQNAAKEFYLTDVVSIAIDDNYKATFVETSEEEVAAANTRAELAHLEKLMQNRLREKAMLNGVTMLSPETVFLSHDTKIEKDVLIEPNVYFGLGVSVKSGVHIKSFCHFEKCTIHENAEIGPFARLRPEADIGESARIGNFVEIKKSKIGKGSKVSHLTYIGDTEIGKGTNIGAGTITCNYDGYFKNKTIIGDNVFVGSNSVFVAPITVDDGAYIAAGSVITKNVESNALAVSRSEQKFFPDGQQNSARKCKRKKMRKQNNKTTTDTTE